ncbi:AAA family ATPase [Caballeronia mineralivorans]|jgi:hypothetical protein|uniref:AAA family ATPase n=1 Tax=Caballeronia mineralivorans TaxID=2010198 RepID=UPI0023F28692|nr:AAA family ATPase [Caballeronia mineralivorans]MDB5788216.1 hypothetical protein [Caballeronia mineralivorans]
MSDGTARDKEARKRVEEALVIPRRANGADDAASVADTAVLDDLHEADRLPLIFAQDIDGSMVAIPQLVEDILTEGGVAEIYGAPTVGKTYFVIECICSVARGVPFLGKRTVQGACVYVACESPASVKGRLLAYKLHHRIKDLPVAVVPQTLDLHDPEADTGRLITATDEAAKVLGKVKLIVIDTLARSMGDGDENSTRDMSAFVHNVTHLSRVTAATVLIVHHSGKDASRGARGSVVLLGGVDTEITATCDEISGIHTLEVLKQRDLSTRGLRLSARFIPVEIGTDCWGKPQTACVLEWVENSADASRPMPRGRTQGIVYAVMKALLQESKNFGKAGAPAGRPCVEVETVVPVIAERLLCRPGQRQYQVRRALTAMTGDGEIYQTTQGWLWIN